MAFHYIENPSVEIIYIFAFQLGNTTFVLFQGSSKIKVLSKAFWFRGQDFGSYNVLYPFLVIG